MYQIGTEEPDECAGSRASRSNVLEEAWEEAREYSKADHVSRSWLREYRDGKLGSVLVTFVNGNEVDEGDEPDPPCTNPEGHEWSQPSEEWDRIYCMWCGADGDA